MTNVRGLLARDVPFAMLPPAMDILRLLVLPIDVDFDAAIGRQLLEVRVEVREPAQEVAINRVPPARPGVGAPGSDQVRPPEQRPVPRVGVERFVSRLLRGLDIRRLPPPQTVRITAGSAGLDSIFFRSQVPVGARSHPTPLDDARVAGL
jgi:hypothetical protein